MNTMYDVFYKTPITDDFERLQAMMLLKEEGNELFRAGEWSDAYYKYCDVCHMVESDEKGSEEYTILIACHSNAAQAAINMHMYVAAANHCTSILQREPKHKKALYRRIIVLCRLGCNGENDVLHADVSLFKEAGGTEADLKEMSRKVDSFLTSERLKTSERESIGLPLFHAIIDFDVPQIEKLKETFIKVENNAKKSGFVGSSIWGFNLAALCIGGNPLATNTEEERNDDSFMRRCLRWFYYFDDPLKNWELIADVLIWATWDWDKCRVGKLLVSLGFDRTTDARVWDRMYLWAMDKNMHETLSQSEDFFLEYL
jgi:hypothetical protein